MTTISPSVSINLSAIVYREDGIWLAHCLELDIVAEGESSDDAIKSLTSLCGLQIRTALEEGDLESIFHPAPPEIWKLFATGKEKWLAERHQAHGIECFDAPVDRLEAREASVT